MKLDFDKLTKRWRLAYIAPLERRIGQAWAWWTAELMASLPEHIRTALTTSRQQTFLQLSGSDVIAFHGSVERMQEIGRAALGSEASSVEIPADTRNVILLLPSGRALCKSITLPAATEENLREVLAFEMDQQTPFTVDQVYYDFVVTDRSAADKTIVVDLVVAPRKQLDELLGSLAALDLSPDIVSTRRDANGMYDVNLLPATGRRSRPASQDRLNLGLAAACALLLIAAATIPILQKRSAISELEPRVAAAMEAAKEGSQMRQNIEKIVSGSKLLAEKKESSPMVMRLLDEITRIVPDGTWVSQLDIKGVEIQVQGQSPAAASLIGLLEESENFGNPQFRSPVTQVPRSNLERFHLSAEWTGGAKQ